MKYIQAFFYDAVRKLAKEIKHIRLDNQRYLQIKKKGLA